MFGSAILVIWSPDAELSIRPNCQPQDLALSAINTHARMEFIVTIMRHIWWVHEAVYILPKRAYDSASVDCLYDTRI